jgi:hypothetical protein
MPDMFADIVTIDEMISEAVRELNLRRTFYPSFVIKKKLTQSKAERQIAVMEAIIKHLEASK